MTTNNKAPKMAMLDLSSVEKRIQNWASEWGDPVLHPHDGSVWCDGQIRYAGTVTGRLFTQPPEPQELKK